MNKFDLEFMNGYIKTGLRLARKINMAKTLDEAKRIALEIEEKAMKKLEETMGDLRTEARKLRFVPIEAMGAYTSLSYKAIDGGKMKISFDPIEIDLGYETASRSSPILSMSIA